MKRFGLLMPALMMFALCCRDGTTATEPSHPRIVSFSPALTRIVFDIGLGNHVVGVTGFCRLPDGEKRTIVGNALNVRAEPVLAVNPDIVLTQIETKQFDPLRKLDATIRVEHFEIETLDDIANTMERIGRLVVRPDIGRKAKETFLTRLNEVREKTNDLPRSRVVFVLGYENPLVPADGTFLQEMIEIAGGVNVFAGNHRGWQEQSLETILMLSPDVIICQSTRVRKADSFKYWEAIADMMGKSRSGVSVVTDENWTIPAGHLPDYAMHLLHMIHPETAPEDTQS